MDQRTPRRRDDSEGKRKLTALTVGGAMIDTIAIIESSGIERISLRNAATSFLMLEEGGKTEAAEISMHCGGGAINTAVAMARLGLSCSVLVKLGGDRRAEQITSRLDEEGISYKFAVHDEREPTGASVHISSHERNAAVFTFRGANTLLCSDDLADAAFAVDLVHIANLSDQAARCYPAIVAKAKRAGARVSANPGVRQLNAHGRAFAATLPDLDILTLNRREADEVVSLLDPREGDGANLAAGTMAPPLAERGLRFEGRRMGLGAFLRALIARGIGTVVVTDGRDGAFAATRDGRVLYCSPLDVQVLGTAGAGDAFAATFAAYLARGSSPDVALEAATLNASAVLGHVDTQTGLLTLAALTSRLAGQNETPKVIEWAL